MTAKEKRGLSPVLDVVLLVLLLVLLLVVTQALLVPVLNHQVEQAHEQRAAAELSDFDAAASAVATLGRPRSVSIDLGTTYPRRPGLLNPPPATGTVAARPLGEVAVSNVAAAGQARDYLTGTVTYNSSVVTYTPSYNEYTSAPTTYYENGMLFNRYAGETRLVTSASALVSGRTISLRLLTGNLSATSTEPTTLTVSPVSAPANTVPVTNTGDGPLTLRLPTNLDEETWRSVLRDQLAENGGYVTGLAVEQGSDGASNTLVLAFEEGETYQLAASQVTVNDETQSEPSARAKPKYAVDTYGNGTTVQPGDGQDVTVVVRDRYNNPVPNATVTASQPGNGVVTVKGDPSSTSTTTDARGRATFRYTAPDSYTGPVEEFDVSIVQPDGEQASKAETVPFVVRQQRPFNIEIVDGTVTSNAPAARVTLVGTAITYGGGADDPRVPVSVEMHVGSGRDATTVEPWPENVNDGFMADGGQRYYSITNQADGVRLSVTATADGNRVSSDTSQNRHPDMVKVLLDGDDVPAISGYGDQDDAEAFLRPYMDADGRIELKDNQAIFLFELGTTDPNSAAADYQDAVVVVTFLNAEGS